MSMLSAAVSRGRLADWRGLLASRWLWCIAAIAFIAARDLGQSFGDLLVSLGDTDDATRLYEVHRLIEGAAWFDMSLPRIGGPTPLISHWSRLIDLPLALLLQGFGLLLSPAAAELATRIVWPLLVLGAFLRILVRGADRQGGASAAALVLLLAVTCMIGLFQFRIGRIDHHNGMIMGSIGGLITLINARQRRADGTIAGVLIGIGLGIGYEPLAFVLPALGVAAFAGVYDMAWLAGVRAMAVALAVTLALIFFATVAPSLWFVARCDALSLNMVLLAAAGAGGIALIDARGRGWSLVQRIGVMAAAGAIGVVLYGAMDARCLAGPFGQIDPALYAVWLDHVVEGASIFTFLLIGPLSVIAFGVTIAIGFWAAIERWRRLRSAETLALLGLLALTAPAGMWMIKLTPYASWVAVFCIALSLADVKPTLHMTALSRQLIGVLLASQSVASMAATPLLRIGGASPAVVKGDAQADDAVCMTTPAIRALDALPKGFIVGSIDFGSYIVALTHHDVLAAPYHRIDKAILANQAILGAEPAEALRLLQAVKADYLVVCQPNPKASAASVSVGGPVSTPTSGIEARLKAGETLAWLAPVALAGAVPELKVWRIVR